MGVILVDIRSNVGESLERVDNGVSDVDVDVLPVEHAQASCSGSREGGHLPMEIDGDHHARAYNVHDKQDQGD